MNTRYGHPGLFMYTGFDSDSYNVKVLDINAYRNDNNLIEIRFSVITKEADTTMIPDNLHKQCMLDDSMLDYHKDKNIPRIEFYFTNSKYIKITPVSDMSSIIVNDTNRNYIQSSIVYQLPTLPHVALNFLSCVSRLISREFDILDCAHINNCPENMPFINDNKQLISMKKYIKLHPIDDIGIDLKLLENILSLKMVSDNPEKRDLYTDVMHTLQKITDSYGCMNIYQSLEKHLVIENRWNILHKDIINQIFYKNLNSAEKEVIILKFGRELIAGDQSAELSYFLKNLNYMALKTFYNSYFEEVKTSSNESVYTWNDDEWLFLQYAEIRLCNERICITNLWDNPIYQHYYAEGKPHHDSFLERMCNFAKALSLEFDPQCDMHSEIIFTLESTQKLKELGIHITEQYIKKIMYSQNFWSIFSHSTAREWKGQNNNQFLTRDVVNCIAEEREMARTAPAPGK